MIDLTTATKKDLKSYASNIKKTNPNFPEYIHITTADEQKLRQYIQAYWEWEKEALARASEELAEQEQEKLDRKHQEATRLESVKTAIINLTQLQSEPIKLSVLGDAIAKFIEIEPNITATTWTKNGEMRIYISDQSMSRSRRGFITVTEKINSRNLDARLENLGFLESLQFQIEDDLTATPRRRSPEQIQEAIKAGENVSPEEIESAMNSMLGEGNWDQWDREDFEG